jgi:uncharacterized protein YjiS (DUF1127 family)
MISRRFGSGQMQGQSRSAPGWVDEILFAVPRALVRRARRAWSAHADRKLLAELSDHQLRDIGIRREHISHVVQHGWDI